MKGVKFLLVLEAELTKQRADGKDAIANAHFNHKTTALTIDVQIEDEVRGQDRGSVLSALHPAARNPQRVSHYRPYERELDFDEIEFPVTIDKLPRFET